MPYLIQNDFLKQIQPGNLAAVIGSNYAIINSWLLAAQETAQENLEQKYDISYELTDTNVWNPAQVYYANDRVYLDAPAYVPATNYVIGNLALVTGNVYYCTAATTGTFDPTAWSLVGPQYTIFYANYPQPVFNVYANYNEGDQVFWKNNVYTARQATSISNQSYVLQYGSYANIPLNNYFPDAPGQGQWGAPTPYQIPGGTPLVQYEYLIALPGSFMITIDGNGHTVYTNPILEGKTGYLVYPRQGDQYLGTGDIQYNEFGFTILVPGFALIDELIIYPNAYSASPTVPTITAYWTQGDNRSQKMVRTLLNIVLYYAHYRISPTSVPKHIEKAYDEAMTWLKEAKDADISPNLVKLQPNKGGRIRFGGDVRLNLRY